MPVDRSLWRRPITAHSTPPWPCPACHEGKLKLDRSTFFSKETAASRRAMGVEGWHFTDYETVFAAVLDCPKCKEAISCSGVGGTIEDFGQDADGEPIIESTEVFYPRYFSRALHIFPLRRQYPKSVTECLKKSFLLSFCDTESAANHIRKCVEVILLLADINLRRQDGRIRPLNERINEFEAIDSNNAKRSHALRIIGNAGSHADTLTRDDLFDGYEILEVTLEDIYIGFHRNIQEKVDRIVSSNKP